MLERFTDYAEHHDLAGGEILVPGRLYSYVAAAFLNGFINYVDIVYAAVVAEYGPLVEETDAVWVEFMAAGHPHLGVFADNVAVLARDSVREHWWVFLYDADVSDCSIGRVPMGGDLASVEQAKQAFVKWLGRQHAAWKRIPLMRLMNGWISY